MTNKALAVTYKAFAATNKDLISHQKLISHRVSAIVIKREKSVSRNLILGSVLGIVRKRLGPSAADRTEV